MASQEIQSYLALIIPMFIMALGLTVFYHNRRSRVNRLLSLFMLSVSVWLFAGIIYFSHSSTVSLLLPLQMSIGSFFGVIFYFFSRAFIEESFSIKPLEVLFIVPAALVALYCIVVILAPGPVPGFNRLFTIVDGHVYREPTMVYFIYSINILAGFTAAITVLIRGYRRERDAARRRRILTVIVSILLGASGVYVLSNVLTMAGLSGYEQYSLLPQLLGLIGVAFTILRDRAWTVEHLLDIIGRRNREMESELETARLLQMRLLPEEGRTAAGCSIHAAYIPMDKVGGDFFDYAERDGAMELFIADVSGHGMPGAFLATVTKIALDGIGERNKPGEVLMKLNKVICRATVMKNFVTAFFCIIDSGRRRMKYCSAGHPPQILYRTRSNECLELTSMGPPLGWFGNLSLKEQEVAIEPGDRLILYTDGVVECRKGEGELFGEDRFFNFITHHGNDPPQVFLDTLLGEIRRYSGTSSFADDITCLVIDLA